MASAEDFSKTPAGPDRDDASCTPLAETNALEPEGQIVHRFDHADLERATACEERAQRLSSRLDEIEDSILSARMFLSASGAIEDLLVESRRLLEKGRRLSDPSSRKALAGTYAEIKSQINDIVSEAEFNGQNLAAGDSLALAFDEAETHVFQTDSHALSIGALGLSQQDCAFSSDAEIIEAIVQIENAINTVRTRQTVTEMALSVLTSRAKFARDKIQSLRSASQLWTGQGKAYGAICEMAARRVAHKPAQKKKRYRRGAPSASQAAGAAGPQPGLQMRLQTLIDDLSRPGDGSELDDLAKELARLLYPESYLNHWFKYEEGETGIFTRFLAQSYGPELIAAAAQKIGEDKKLKDVAERYMSKFDARVEWEVGDESDRKAKIDELLKTDQGTIYVVLARACGLV